MIQKLDSIDYSKIKAENLNLDVSKIKTQAELLEKMGDKSLVGFMVLGKTNAFNKKFTYKQTLNIAKELKKRDLIYCAANKFNMKKFNTSQINVTKIRKVTGEEFAKYWRHLRK